MRTLALIALLLSLASDSQAVTKTCASSPCEMSITITATIMSTATLVLEQSTLPTGERLIVAVETCSGCEESGPRETKWIASPRSFFVFTHGDGAREVLDGKTYAGRRYEPGRLLAGTP